MRFADFSQGTLVYHKPRKSAADYGNFGIVLMSDDGNSARIFWAFSHGSTPVFIPQVVWDAILSTLDEVAVR